MRKGQRSEIGPQQGAAMSFKQIGAALGITRGGAWMAYKSGMSKLRKNKMPLLLLLVELQRMKGRYL